ncbi:MAG: alanine racemase [Oscillospiraceae bacterium]|jgi:alanine racemase|nr:alanine racemase [Oscillospiraceae bacterium]
MIHERDWTELDYSALAYNYAWVRERIGSGVRLLVPVKANAYGHGAAAIARELERLGVDCFGVATLSEGELLRANGVTKPVLILGYTASELLPRAVELGLTQTITSCEAFEDYRKICNSRELTENPRTRGKKLACQLKLNTGMSRYGLEASDDRLPKLFDVSELKITGVFTHLAVSDETEAVSVEFTNRQLDIFENALKRLRRYDIGLVHAANSGAVANHPRSFAAPYNMVRPGLLLYGYGAESLRPVLSWKANVTLLRRIPKGNTVSYGAAWTAKRDSLIAVLPVGYADGYNRLLSNSGEVFINGKRAPICGRVCMDITMIDVTEIPEVRLGDTAELLGKNITANELAQKLNTIPYEILCNVRRRC